MQNISSGQVSAEVPINENFTLLQHQQVYGYNASTSSGLTWGYWGGVWGGATISTATLTLTASTTNYIVVNRSTGAISVSTATTNWNDQVNYARVYTVLTGTTTVTSSVDYRAGSGGVHGAAVGLTQFAENVNAQTGTTYTIQATDNSKLVTLSNAASIAVTLPIASTFGTGFWFDIANRGAGTVTITPATSTIDGAASLTLTTGQGVHMVSDGANYFTVRGLPAAGAGAALGSVNVFTKNQSVAAVALTSGATISTDASLSNNFKLTLATNATLANPTNLTDGMVLNFRIKQDATGGRTLAYGTMFKFPTGSTPTLSTSANAVDLLRAYYDSTDNTLQCELFSGTYTATVNARTLVSSNRTYYVSTIGSNSNDGLSVGAPFLTIQKASDVICSTLDIAAGVIVTIQLADGTYTAGANFTTFLGAGSVVLQGNSTTPSNVVISTTSADCVTTSGVKNFTVKDFKVQTTTSGYGFIFSDGSVVQYGNIVFGACVSGHIAVTTYAVITAISNYSIVGSSVYHFFVISGGRAICSGRTLTITGTPAFSGSFLSMNSVSTAFLTGNTYSGAATGTRHSVTQNSVSEGGGTLPGSVAGTTATGGQYL